MNCPFCQTPAQEDTPECLHCGFSMPKLDSIFGEPPVVERRITDYEGLLTKDDLKRLHASIDRFHARFPQVGFHFWLGPVDQNIPLHLYMFWVFNRGSIPTRGGVSAVNREIMLGVDSTFRRAVLVTGYGLEPFVGHRHLTEIMDKGRPEMAAGHWRKAAQTVIEQFADLLGQLHGAMGKTYGAVPAELGLPTEPLGTY